MSCIIVIKIVGSPINTTALTMNIIIYIYTHIHTQDKKKYSNVFSVVISKQWNYRLFKFSYISYVFYIFIQLICILSINILLWVGSQGQNTKIVIHISL